MAKKIRCCICGKEIKDEIHDANNPDPLLDENGVSLGQDPDNVCCKDCDNAYVIAFRVCKHFRQEKQCAEIQQHVLDLRKGWLNK